MFGINLTRKSTTNAPVMSEGLPVTVRKDWKWFGADKLAALEVLKELRTRTIEFSDDNNLDWAVTEYNLPTAGGVLEIKVALTPEQDVEYSITGVTTFDQKEAANWIEALRTQELIF